MRQFLLRTATSVCICAALFEIGCSSKQPTILGVTGISPATITAGATGATVKVTGEQFNGKMTVVLGGQSAATTFVSAEELDAVVPAGVSGTGGSYALGIRDDESQQGGSATLTTGLALQVNNPVPTATAVSPSTFLSGGAGASATITGTNFVTGTTATVDGSSRTVQYVNATTVVVQLTADDLLYATTRAIALTNAAPAGSATTPVNITVQNYRRTGTLYHAYGDSITRGVNADPGLGYTYLLAAANNLALTDPAQDGDQACDAFPRQIFPQSDGFGAAAGVVYSQMSGTNDTYVKGTGTYESVYKLCHQATMAWLALPRTSKLLAGDAGLTTTGGCANTQDANRLGTLYCATGGAVAVPSLATYGSPLYVWYYVDDAAAASSGFSLIVDGATVGTYATLLSPTISTQNGSTRSIALARVPLSAGTHTVNVVTQSGGAGLLGFGTVPASKAGLSFLVMGDIPVQNVTSPRASAAVQLQYSADARADFLALTSDGLDLRFAPTRQYMLGTAAEMSDSLHPNDLGHQHLASAFQLGMQGLNSTNGVVAQYRGGLTVLADGPVWLVDPPVAEARYQLPAGAELVSVGNISSHGEAALIVAPQGTRFRGGAQTTGVAAGAAATFTRLGAEWTEVRSPDANRLTPDRSAGGLVR